MYNANELRIVQNLQNNIECELNRIGLLYRFFSRTKSERRYKFIWKWFNGKDDIVIGAIYETGAGPQGMIPYTQIRIYEDIGSEFVYDQELCDAINVELPEDATAEQVKEMIN